jgi:hypothetical protein
VHCADPAGHGIRLHPFVRGLAGRDKKSVSETIKFDCLIKANLSKERDAKPPA